METANPVTVRLYCRADNEEALELEKQCIQGKTFRMTFRRSAFHRRAENYSEWQIFTARIDNRLVGIAAVAVKDALLFGVATRASFFFDLRVHPEYRGRGIGRSLMRDACEWGIARSEIAYTYTLADNRTATYLGKMMGGKVVGGFSYLVYPVFHGSSAVPRAERVSFAAAHDAMLASSPRYDFYSRPDLEARPGGYVGSWVSGNGGASAGCSAWNNHGILGEAIESVPGWLQLAGRVAGASRLFRHRFPRLPARGEELRSWYLFDFFSTDDRVGRDLMRFVARQAFDSGIDYCYLPHGPNAGWIQAIKREAPSLIVPVVPYCMLAGGRNGQVSRIGSLYVDIRDL
jgi:GNAT superfamily N-acetyltransferase